LIKVDKDNRRATFKTGDGEVESDYDLLHIVPPQKAPDFIANSSLAAQNGFVDVDAATMRHKKVNNVFAIGDCANLPTAKTAAGVFSQAPVLVNNLIQLDVGKDLTARYNGYNSCPLFVGDKKLMMIEFKYDNLPSETFYDRQTEPNRLFYHMKKDVFPRVYFNLVPTGYWYGHKTVIKPRFA